MKYDIYEPSIHLAEFVKYYCVLENSIQKNAKRKTIIPQGTMKMIFHYGDLYEHYDESGLCTILPRCYVIGQLTKPFEVKATGKTGMFYIHFRTEGFRPLTTYPLDKMKDEPMPISYLFGENGKIIEQLILIAKTTEERIKHIEDFLLNQLINVISVDNIVKFTVENILTTNGGIPIKDLSEKIKINRKQLERKFSNNVGLSPKQLSKTIRLQSILKSLINAEKISLTELAYENNYYDQSHFIKEFKEFTGLTPKEFYKDQLSLYKIFYG